MSELIQVDLPEGSVMENYITIVSYFDGEGTMRFYIATRNEAHVSSLLGLIEVAKFSLMDQAS